MSVLGIPHLRHPTLMHWQLGKLNLKALLLKLLYADVVCSESRSALRNSNWISTLGRARRRAARQALLSDLQTNSLKIIPKALTEATPRIAVLNRLPFK